MAKLTRKKSGMVFELPHGVTAFGRRSTNEIQINETRVSRSHCKIEGPEGGWMLSDLESKLGTFVNGRRVAQHRLLSGDQVRVGSEVFVFEDPDQAPVAKPVAVPQVRPLSETAAEKLIPQAVAEPVLIESPGRQRVRRAIIGLLLAAVVALAVAALLRYRRETPEKAVRKAAEMLCARQGDELWTLLARGTRRAINKDDFRYKIDDVPNELLLAITETLEVGRPERNDGRTIVPVKITVNDKARRGGVVLASEDGELRIASAWIEDAQELKLPAALAKE